MPWDGVVPPPPPRGVWGLALMLSAPCLTRGCDLWSPRPLEKLLCARAGPRGAECVVGQALGARQQPLFRVLLPVLLRRPSTRRRHPRRCRGRWLLRSGRGCALRRPRCGQRGRSTPSRSFWWCTTSPRRRRTSTVAVAMVSAWPGVLLSGPSCAATTIFLPSVAGGDRSRIVVGAWLQCCLPQAPSCRQPLPLVGL